MLHVLRRCWVDGPSPPAAQIPLLKDLAIHDMCLAFPAKLRKSENERSRAENSKPHQNAMNNEQHEDTTKHKSPVQQFCFQLTQAATGHNVN